MDPDILPLAVLTAKYGPRMDTNHIDHLIPSVALARGMTLTAGQVLGTTGSAYGIDLGVINDTLTLLDAVGFAGAYTFAYSARPGTPAAEMEQIPEHVKTGRLHRLQAEGGIERRPTTTALPWSSRSRTSPETTRWEEAAYARRSRWRALNQSPS